MISTQDIQVGDIVRWGRSKDNQVIEVLADFMGLGPSLRVRRLKDGKQVGKPTVVGLDEITSVTR